MHIILSLPPLQGGGTAQGILRIDASGVFILVSGTFLFNHCPQSRQAKSWQKCRFSVQRPTFFGTQSSSTSHAHFRRYDASFASRVFQATSRPFWFLGNFLPDPLVKIFSTLGRFFGKRHDSALWDFSSRMEIITFRTYGPGTGGNFVEWRLCRLDVSTWTC